MFYVDPGGVDIGVVIGGGLLEPFGFDFAPVNGGAACGDAVAFFHGSSQKVKRWPHCLACAKMIQCPPFVGAHITFFWGSRGIFGAA